MFGALLGTGAAVVAPLWQYATPEFTFALGLNSASRDRYNLYRNNVQACLYPRGPDRTPSRLGFAQLLQLFNQGPWGLADTDPDLRTSMWEQLRNDLRALGIDMRRYEDMIAGAPFDLSGEFQADQWTRLINMSCSSAPLGAVIRDYYRSQGQPEADQAVSDYELRFNLSRAQYRRPEDRERLTNPYYDWSPDDITRLAWAGKLTNEAEANMRRAAGMTRTEDRAFRDLLEQRIPDPAGLLKWAARGLWNDNQVAAMSLDEGYADSPIARYFAKIGGIGQPVTGFADQPEGETDWAKLAYRDQRHLPTFGEAREMQIRLRPSTTDPTQSVQAGIAPWSAEQTQQLLYTHGIPEPIAKQMMGLVREPMPLHMLAVVLTPLLEHPTIRQIANQLYPNNEDWLKEALRDHGYDRKHVTLMAAAIRQEAEDKANAEMIALKKALRQQNRDARFEAYRLGIEDDATTRGKVTGPHYTEAMADDQMAVIELEISNRIYGVKMGAIKQAFMSGQKNTDQTKAAFDTVGIAEARRDQYIDEWTWERTTDQKQLTTGEIMAALKNGLINQGTAVQRMTNLGWNQPDALIEVQLIQRELATAQAKAAATVQAHAQQHAAQQTRAQRIAAAHAAADATKAAAKAAKISKEQLLATHEKLMAESTYYAKVHMDNSAYAAADKAGDEEKKAAELLKEQTAYQEWLLKQLELITEGQGVANEIGPVQTAQAPGPQPSPPVNGAASPPNPPSG